MPEQNTTDAPETAEASEPADAPASRPLTQRGLDRRRALLMHSADLFIEVGYERTSIREIIARAGGSRSLIYQCFKNKHGLFLACLQMTVDDVYSSYVQEGRKGLTLDEELLTFGRIFLEHMTNRRALGLLRLIFSETTRFHEIGEWYWREGVMQSWVCFARVMRDYVDLPDEELIDAARSYINLLKGGLVEECLANPSLVPTEARIRAEVERAAGWIADALVVRQARFERALLRALKDRVAQPAAGYDFSALDFDALGKLTGVADAADAVAAETEAKPARTRKTRTKKAAETVDAVDADEVFREAEALSAAVAAARGIESDVTEAARAAVRLEDVLPKVAAVEETVEEPEVKIETKAEEKAEDAAPEAVTAEEAAEPAEAAEAPKRKRTPKSCVTKIAPKANAEGAFAKPLGSELGAQEYRAKKEAAKAAAEAGEAAETAETGESGEAAPKPKRSRKTRASLIGAGKTAKKETVE